jgi:hypothetical protein
MRLGPRARRRDQEYTRGCQQREKRDDRQRPTVHARIPVVDAIAVSKINYL